MAVYTKITQAQIDEHLTKYNIGQLINLKEIVEGIDNSNFILTTTVGKFILTIFESRINKDELPFFINLKLHLARKGICCPQPILDNQGQVIVDLLGKKSSIVTFLSGKTLQARADGYYDNILQQHCYEIGKTLAQLHLAAQDFKMQRENDLGIKGWRPLFRKFENLVDDYQLGLREEILQHLNFLEKSWNHNLPCIPVHVDLFPDNVFFDEAAKVSGVIDFYFAANDSGIYDFAVCANAWCFDEKNNFSAEKFLAMKKGYETLHKFTDEELQFLSVALIGASMRFLLTRLHDMFFTPKNSLVKIKDPQEYLAKLRFFATAF